VRTLRPTARTRRTCRRCRSWRRASAATLPTTAPPRHQQQNQRSALHVKSVLDWSTRLTTQGASRASPPRGISGKSAVARTPAAAPRPRSGVPPRRPLNGARAPPRRPSPSAGASTATRPPTSSVARPPHSPRPPQSADAQRSGAAVAAVASAAASPLDASSDSTSSPASAALPPLRRVEPPTSPQLANFERDADSAQRKLWESTGTSFLLPDAPLEPVTEAQHLERLRAYNEAMNPHMRIDVCASCGIFELGVEYVRLPLASLAALRLFDEVSCSPPRSLCSTLTFVQSLVAHHAHPYRELFTVYECHDHGLNNVAFHLHGHLLEPPARTVRL
jgi:hypothetical protein